MKNQRSRHGLDQSRGILNRGWTSFLLVCFLAGFLNIAGRSDGATQQTREAPWIIPNTQSISASPKRTWHYPDTWRRVPSEGERLLEVRIGSSTSMDVHCLKANDLDRLNGVQLFRPGTQLPPYPTEGFIQYLKRQGQTHFNSGFYCSLNFWVTVVQAHDSVNIRLELWNHVNNSSLKEDSWTFVIKLRPEDVFFLVRCTGLPEELVQHAGDLVRFVRAFPWPATPHNLTFVPVRYRPLDPDWRKLVDGGWNLDKLNWKDTIREVTNAPIAPHSAPRPAEASEGVFGVALLLTAAAAIVLLRWYRTSWRRIERLRKQYPLTQDAAATIRSQYRESSGRCTAEISNKLRLPRGLKPEYRKRFYAERSLPVFVFPGFSESESDGTGLGPLPPLNATQIALGVLANLPANAATKIYLNCEVTPDRLMFSIQDDGYEGWKAFSHVLLHIHLTGPSLSIHAEAMSYLHTVAMGGPSVEMQNRTFALWGMVKNAVFAFAHERRFEAHEIEERQLRQF